MACAITAYKKISILSLITAVADNPIKPYHIACPANKSGKSASHFKLMIRINCVRNANTNVDESSLKAAGIIFRVGTTAKFVRLTMVSPKLFLNGAFVACM
jgi:hypothetical protein